MRRLSKQAQLSRALLAELLLAFGADAEQRAIAASPPSARRVGAARATAPTDLAEYTARHHADLESAGEVLADVVARLRELRAPVLPSPESYRDGWTYVLQKWNDAIDAFGWATLPRLCEGCGRPLLVRAGRACDRRCARRVQKRRARERG